MYYKIKTCERDAIIDLLRTAVSKPTEMQEIMRKHGLKIDDLDNPMQKLAFTLYTELVEMATRAKSVLEKVKHVL